MKKINKDNLISVLKENLPKFTPFWEDFVKNWGLSMGLTTKLYPFSDYVVATIKSGDNDEIKKIFDFVEFLLHEGSNEVKDAIATGFLEDLLNKDPDEIRFIKFTQYLGKETIAYCRAWNEFCGVYTEGINKKDWKHYINQTKALITKFFK